jgi:hypothetical protein
MSAIPLAQTAGLRTGHNALFHPEIPPEARSSFESSSLGLRFRAGKLITKLRFVGMVAIWQRPYFAAQAT